MPTCEPWSCASTPSTATGTMRLRRAEVDYVIPIGDLRVAAIMNVAMFDAANGVYRQFHPIHFDRFAPRGTSRRAAVIGAAYTTLSKLFPTLQSEFDADEAASLAAMTDDEDDDGSGQSTSLGLAWGATVANDILAWRATDGFTTA